MNPRWLIVSLLLPALAGGCASDKSYALVSVLSSGGQFNDVAQLHVEARNAASLDMLDYKPRAGTAVVRFDETQPLTFSIGYHSSSHTGTLLVAVTPLDQAGKVLGYGEGTAVLVADQITNVTVRVTRGASPPARLDGGAPDGEAPDAAPLCDPVTPTTCNGGTCYLACRTNQPAVGMCTAGGSKQPGEACTGNEECSPGSQCFTFSCGSQPVVKTCLRFCNDDSVCGTGHCGTPVPCGGQSTSFKACSRTCDPVGTATQGCAAGLRCFVFAGESPDCDCAGDTHVKTEGTDCAVSDECLPGLLCVKMAAGKTCRPLCRLDTPGTCAEGQKCTLLVDPEYKTYGACLP
jgi:hypothetical protein